CIMGEIPFEGNLKIGHNVQIGYFAQNQAQLLDESLTVFQTIDYVAKGEIRTRIKDILGAFMFGGEEADKKVKVLSGGERSRLAMIRLLLEPVNLLILDEPTNHLDMQSKDVLKEAIRAFDGTAIIVSHDREFLDGLVTKVYEFGGGRVREHLGGIYDWLRAPHLLPPEGGGSKDTMTIDERLNLNSKASPTGGGLVGASKASTRGGLEGWGGKEASPNGGRLEGASYAEQKEQQRRLRKAENAVKACEEKIAKLEARIKEMDAILILPEHASDMQLVNEYAETMRQLDEENERWMTLSEALEALKSTSN
ncbi:MAG: ABC-F family ATP-binding cassette domain-containing protein, partial [Prevotella sp.]|nr:ABC-F family ATP-binding cassette domain-containing protein [Prevotella sp.]